MAKPQAASNAHGNRLLARLPPEEYQHLLPNLQLVRLELRQVLYEAGAPIKYAYFPQRGSLTSVITLMRDGSAIEVGTIGNEGMVGVSILLGVNPVLGRYFIQAPGEALRMRAEVLQEETSRDNSLRRLLLRYHGTFLAQVMQAAACNGLHTVPQRCCRWLLTCHDRVQSDQLPLTHEFLSLMLGVRRASVTEVLHPFQEDGSIRYKRGVITILDRPALEAGSCECYRIISDEFARLLG